MVSPPMFTIAPGTQQLVRVVRVGGTPAANGEQSYRLLIDEVPDPTAPSKTTLNFVLRYSVPVFIGNADSAPELNWNSTAMATRRSEEHTSELQSLMRTSYAVFCLKKNNT